MAVVASVVLRQRRPLLSLTALTPYVLRRSLHSTSKSAKPEGAPKPDGLASWVQAQEAKMAGNAQGRRFGAPPEQMPRRFRLGEPFRPVDFKRENIFPGRKPRPLVRLGPSRAETYVLDPFKRFKIDPLREPHNVGLLTPFLGETGRIHGRVMTGLSKKNQRKVTKAIKRARCMGMLPVFGRDDSGQAPQVRPSIPLGYLRR